MSAKRHSLLFACVAAFLSMVTSTALAEVCDKVPPLHFALRAGWMAVASILAVPLAHMFPRSAFVSIPVISAPVLLLLVSKRDVMGSAIAEGCWPEGEIRVLFVAAFMATLAIAGTAGSRAWTRWATKRMLRE